MTNSHLNCLNTSIPSNLSLSKTDIPEGYSMSDNLYPRLEKWLSG